VPYELVKTRMELDRQAERRRLARTEMPRVQRAPARSRAPGNSWRDAIARYPRIIASSHDRSQRVRAGEVALPPAGPTARHGPAGQ
jgi:hypothetical protein